MSVVVVGYENRLGSHVLQDTGVGGRSARATLAPMDVPTFETVVPFLRVRDLAATHDFYGRDLGLRLEREEPTCLVFAVGGGYLGFVPDEPHDADGRVPDTTASSRDDVMATFVTQFVDDWYARVRRLGIETEGAPRYDPGLAAYGFVARDPDGYRIDFRRFDAPLR